MGEVIKIPVDLMKEDLGRISQWISLIKDIQPVALSNVSIDRPQSSRAMNIARSRGDAEPLLDYATVSGVLAVADVVIESILDAYDKRRPPLSNNQENENFTNFVSGSDKYSTDELFRDRSIGEIFSGKGKSQDSYKQEALQVLSALFYTRDLFTIFSNLLPTLSRIEKLLTLQTILLAESAHCAGDSHPVASALRKFHAEGLVPWMGNEEVLDDGPTDKLFQQLRPHMTEGYPVPPDFASFAQNYPSWDAFWQIASWKAHRMEQAFNATVRELLIEAWKCPEKPVSPTPPDPEEPVAEERRWDWATEKESVTPRIPRERIRPFAYGKGHPVADSLWDAVWDAEHERRSYTDEIPLTFPKDLHTFRCAVPVETNAVQEILDRPWRHTAEEDVPDFSNLWGGFAKEAQRILGGTGAEVKEEKSIHEDLLKGMESTYKRGIGMLDHLAGVHEYYRPLRAIDPAEWRDMAENLKMNSSVEFVAKSDMGE